MDLDLSLASLSPSVPSGASNQSDETNRSRRDVLVSKASVGIGLLPGSREFEFDQTARTFRILKQHLIADRRFPRREPLSLDSPPRQQLPGRVAGVEISGRNRPKSIGMRRDDSNQGIIRRKFELPTRIGRDNEAPATVQGVESDAIQARVTIRRDEHDGSAGGGTAIRRHHGDGGGRRRPQAYIESYLWSHPYISLFFNGLGRLVGWFWRSVPAELPANGSPADHSATTPNCTRRTLPLHPNETRRGLGKLFGPMKKLYRLYRRGNTGNYYLQNNQTREQRSLGTKNRQEALKLLFAENQVAQSPALNLEIGKAYLTHANPKLATRTWGEAISALASHGKPQSQSRTLREFRSKAYDTIRDKPMALTNGEDFLLVLRRGKAATSNYLRRLHNLALTSGWILTPILPANGWGKVQEREKRAINHEEHLRILAAEGNQERKLYYELLWLTGAAQTDGASLCAENVNWAKEFLAYQRAKTGEWCHLKLSSGLIALLRQLPTQGPLFPKIAKEKNNHRAAEFYRRLKLLGITGVSLHSYRYAWAERAYSSGYEQRFAQAALGHKSAAVHHAYARNARVECPPLEEPGNLRPFPTVLPGGVPNPVTTVA